MTQRPPGNDGPPLIGETLRFMKDIFGFVNGGAERFGPIFRSRILGRPTVVISGPEATDLFVDGERVQRSGAMPPNIQEMFGGESLPALDGVTHKERKAAVMQAFTRSALESYVPVLKSATRDAIGSQVARTVLGKDVLQRLAIESICRIMPGLTPGPELDAVRKDYERVVTAIAALPIPLPWTAYGKGKRAIKRILAVYANAIAEHLKSERDDGLGRMLKTGMAHDAIQREMHHIVIAGYIVWGWFVTALIELASDPTLKQTLGDEVKNLPDDYDAGALMALPRLRAFSMEVRRVSPVVPVSFGKARTDLVFDGKSIPKDAMVLWSPSASNLAPIFTSPKSFDPARFDAPRHEDERHPHAYVPNGGGDPQTGHKCAGHTLSALMLQIFVAELLRSYNFTLPNGRPAYDTAKIPAEPKDGLPLRIERA